VRTTGGAAGMGVGAAVAVAVDTGPGFGPSAEKWTMAAELAADANTTAAAAAARSRYFGRCGPGAVGDGCFAVSTFDVPSVRGS